MHCMIFSENNTFICTNEAFIEEFQKNYKNIEEIMDNNREEKLSVNHSTSTKKTLKNSHF